MSDKLAVARIFDKIAGHVNKFFAEKPKNFTVAFVADAATALTEVRNDIAGLRAQASAIVQSMEAEGRTDLDEVEAEMAAKIDADLKAAEKREKILAIAAGVSTGSVPASPQAGRRTTPVAPQAPAPVQAGNLDRNALTSGEFFIAARHSRLGIASDMARKLDVQMATQTYANESVGSEGGFLVPADVRQEIWQKVMGGSLSLIARTSQMVTQSNSVQFPTDETTPWGTAGVQSYWGEEGGTIPESRPKFGYASLRVNKLTAMVPTTEEMMQDARFVDSYIRTRVPLVMDADINDAIFRGDGVGKPKGLLNSAATVTVPKETGQAADTVLYANIVNMWTRLDPRCRANAVWLISPQVEAQLMQMAFLAGAPSPVPVYLPANGAAGEPFATLMGRPVLPIQDASALGDRGDIVLADLSQYLVVTKGALRTDTSMHFYFNQDATAIRFVFRIAGQPWWSAPVAQKNSPDTLSCFVTLADRA